MTLQREVDRLRRALAALIPPPPDPARLWWVWCDQVQAEITAIQTGELPDLIPPYPLEPGRFEDYLRALGLIVDKLPPNPATESEGWFRVSVADPFRIWAIGQARVLEMLDRPELRSLWPDPVTLAPDPPPVEVPPERARWGGETELPPWWGAFLLVSRAAAERAGVKPGDWDKPLPPRPEDRPRRRA
jgi:hypothetical protein